jgi:hypothetical protein
MTTTDDPWELTRQHPDDYRDWQNEAFNGETLRGFSDWLAAKRDEAAAQALTEADVDRLVWGALTDDHMPAGHLWDTLPITPADVRASLLRLQADGLAALVYGRGWKKLRKVVPND